MSAADARSDVIVLGAGLAGTTTALCLARQGLTVTVVDREAHPRFALGESTTTPSSLWLRVLAQRFSVPELLHIASHDQLCRHVGPGSGVKNNFGFLYHEPGGARPTRSWQAVIPTAALSECDLHSHPRGGEMHYFRQDVDAYLWSRALAAGVSGRLETEVARISFDGGRVAVQTRAGETLQAAFLVDASGFRSPLARQLGLRDATPRFRTSSRTMFTHMAGVVPYDRCWHGERSVSPWHQGTLHHFFDGGWIWVIPFDNHEQSRNPLCSVGINLDNHRATRGASTAADEWRQVLGRFPAIATQFADATPARPWVATDRVQYSSARCVGDRFWMTPHAVGAVDALYSMGNINTFQAVAAAVPVILAAFRDDEFTAERFAGLQRLCDNLHRFQDRVVFGSYAALRDPALLDTWLALWALTDTARIREVLIPMVRHARTGDNAELAFYDTQPDRVFTGLGHCTGVEDTPALLDRLDSWCDAMQAMAAGRATVAETAAALRQEIESARPYRVDLDLMSRALGSFPWQYAPLNRNGLRAYCATFLTTEEVNSIGVPAADRSAAREP